MPKRHPPEGAVGVVLGGTTWVPLCVCVCTCICTCVCVCVCVHASVHVCECLLWIPVGGILCSGLGFVRLVRSVRSDVRGVFVCLVCLLCLCVRSVLLDWPA